MLVTMGFMNSLVKLIMRCISSVSYQFLLNGKPCRNFSPKMGLCQGYPLSPYLFILCEDILYGLLKKETETNTIHGDHLARKAPNISDLLLAEDILIFSRETPMETNKIIEILTQYQQSSWQLVNLKNSKDTFSLNIIDNVKDTIYKRIGVKTVQSHLRYLRLPVLFGKSNRGVLASC